MVLLVHNSVLPQCRKIRILMAEKKMLFVLKEENPWKLSKDIMKINPAGELPVFIYYFRQLRHYRIFGRNLHAKPPY